MAKFLKEEEMNLHDIYEVADAIYKGKIVIFKTDTVYGIGTNAYDENACKRIYEIKKRPPYKPLTVLVSSKSMLEDMVEVITFTEQKLMDIFWPGFLTIKFKKKKGVLPGIVSAYDDYVRIRLINDGIIYKLISTSLTPVVAPSANLSCHPTGVRIESIMRDFKDKVDYILDGGDVEDGDVSTIVEVKGEKVILIREGKIKRETLESYGFCVEDDLCIDNPKER